MRRVMKLSPVASTLMDAMALSSGMVGCAT
jgi:hypothetical protein